MRRIVNLRPSRGGAAFLAALPFVLVLVTYLIASSLRLADNPDDKVLPAFGSFASAIQQYAVDADRRTGEILLWSDTLASLKRLGMGLGVSAALGLVLGIAVGIVPFLRAGLAGFLAAFALVPPLAMLPILFIVFGLDELSKVMLIVIGVAPFLVRDVALRAGEIPAEQMIKAQTLGASSWQLTLRVVLPQMLPRLIDTLRLSLGSAWLFLISAEAISADSGLGYRIFLIRRYLAMDVILPYVAWITLLAFLMDYALRKLNQTAYPWYADGSRR